MMPEGFESKSLRFQHMPIASLFVCQDHCSSKFHPHHLNIPHTSYLLSLGTYSFFYIFGNLTPNNSK